MSINFSTKNIILVFYPQGAAGKFLINCLAFADNCYFPFDIEKSYKNTSTQLDKFSIITSRLDQVDDYWNDLRMHNPESLYDNIKIFNFNENVKKICYKNFDLLSNLSQLYHWNNIYSNLSKCNSNKKFIIACYSIEELYFYKSVWKNASIVYVENTFKFLNQHRKNYFLKNKELDEAVNLLQYVYPVYKEYKSIKGIDWPKFPTNEAQWKAVDSKIIDEIKLLSPTLTEKIKKCITIINFYQTLKKDNNTFFWNADNYLNSYKFVKELKKIYTNLDLTNFNNKYIMQYYTRYFDKISAIKKVKKIDYASLNCNDLLNYQSETINQLKKYLEHLDFKTATYKLNELEKILECYQKKQELLTESHGE